MSSLKKGYNWPWVQPEALVGGRPEILPKAEFSQKIIPTEASCGHWLTGNGAGCKRWRWAVCVRLKERYDGSRYKMQPSGRTWKNGIVYEGLWALPFIDKGQLKWLGHLNWMCGTRKLCLVWEAQVAGKRFSSSNVLLRL